MEEMEEKVKLAFRDLTNFCRLIVRGGNPFIISKDTLLKLAFGTPAPDEIIKHIDQIIIDALVVEYLRNTDKQPGACRRKTPAKNAIIDYCPEDLLSELIPLLDAVDTFNEKLESRISELNDQEKKVNAILLRQYDLLMRVNLDNKTPTTEIGHE